MRETSLPAHRGDWSRKESKWPKSLGSWYCPGPGVSKHTGNGDKRLGFYLTVLNSVNYLPSLDFIDLSEKSAALFPFMVL